MFFPLFSGVFTVVKKSVREGECFSLFPVKTLREPSWVLDAVRSSLAPTVQLTADRGENGVLVSLLSTTGVWSSIPSPSVLLSPCERLVTL